MKKIISAMIICAMLLATLLAVVPASAADELTRDDLKALIDKVEALDETKYVEATWKTLQTALKSAKDIYVNESSPASLIKVQYGLLETAFKGLKVNTKEIDALIKKANELVESDYTPESWAAFKEILSGVITDSDSNDIPTVEAAMETLKAAMADTLVALPVDEAPIKELADLIKLANLLVPSDYSDSAWGMVAMKLEQADATIKNPTITGYETAIQQLNTALCNLTTEKVLPLPAVPDVTVLVNILTYIDGNFEESMFTAESWAALKGPYDAAVALRDAAVKHGELYDEYKDLYKAYKKANEEYLKYVEKVDLAQSRYEEAQRDFEKGEVTEADVTAALEVLDAAKADAEAPKAARDEALDAVDAIILEIVNVARKQEEVQPTYEALNVARAAMVEKPTEPATEPPVTEPPVEETGCGGVIGATAVVITAVLGLGVTVLNKKH